MVLRVPGFLLRRLYLPGSLRNNAEGFQFQLKNTLGSGYARRLLPLKVDGEPVPLDRAFFRVEGATTPFSAVSEQSPFTLAMNRVTTVEVRGVHLPPGPHTIHMGFEVPGLGVLEFDFTDEVPS